MTFAGLLTDYPTELRADLQQYFGVNLDHLGGALSVTHAAALSCSLPRGSRTLAKIDPNTQWTDLEYLVFGLANSLRDKEHKLQLPWKNETSGKIALDQDEYARRLSLPRSGVKANGEIG